MVLGFDRVVDCEKNRVSPFGSFNLFPCACCVLRASRQQAAFPLDVVRNDAVGFRVDETNDRCATREIGIFWTKFERPDKQRAGTDMATVETGAIEGFPVT